MDDRYNIYKKRFRINQQIFVYVDSVDDLYELVNYVKKSKYKTKPKYNEVGYFMQSRWGRRLRHSDRYCLIITPNDGDIIYDFDTFGISILSARKDMVLSYSDEKQLILKLFGQQTPSYKPKKIKRTI